jgi:hypothetical protein
MAVILIDLFKVTQMPGEYIFEIILLCALAAIVLIPLGIKLSQKALSNKSKTDSTEVDGL